MKIHIKISISLILAVIIFCLTSIIFVNDIYHASAVVITDLKLDNTRIEDDLADVDLDAFLSEQNSDLSILEFVEYCYSDNILEQSNYALYIYIYNPKALTFSIGSTVHSINIAVSYDVNGKPNDYENINLIYIDRTTEKYDKLFYKFRVADVSKLKLNATAYSKKYGERRYDFVGIQLREADKTLPKDYGVGGTWHYTGFAKGYGADISADSTLDCSVTDLETVKLDIFSTFYRPEGIVTEGIQHQLSSVYFSVPKRFKTDYGNLYKIKAEWNEQKTNFVTYMNNIKDYNAFKPYVGKNINADDSKYSFVGKYNSNYNSGLGWFRYADFIYNASTLHRYDFTTAPSYLGMGTYSNLSAVFNSNLSMSGEKLRNDLLSTSNEIGGNKINDTYSTVLFSGSVDNGRTLGNNVHDISVDNEYNLTSSVLNQNWWEKFFGIKNYNTTYDNVRAIQEVLPASLEGSADEVSNRLYIDKEDIVDFKTFYNKKSATDDIHLFRFAVTDYYSVNIASDYAYRNGEAPGPHADVFNSCGYAATETMFLSFDIIQLTYSKDGVYTVIPVVADPIDIIADIRPPVGFDPSGCNADWVQMFVAIFLILLLVVLVFTIIEWVYKKTKSTSSKSKKSKKRKR